MDNKDRQFTGSLNPDFYGSFTNDFSYKNFDLNIFMTFSSGREVFNGLNYSLLSGAAANNNRKEMLNRWTSTNPTDKIQDRHRTKVTGHMQGGVSFCKMPAA